MKSRVCHFSLLRCLCSFGHRGSFEGAGDTDEGEKAYILGVLHDFKFCTAAEKHVEFDPLFILSRSAFCSLTVRWWL